MNQSCQHDEVHTSKGAWVQVEELIEWQQFVKEAGLSGTVPCHINKALHLLVAPTASCMLLFSDLLSHLH